MPRAAWAVVVWAAIGTGCDRHLFRSDRPAAPTVARSLAPAASSDGLLIESLLLERPAGDPILDRDLWAAALWPGSPEARALLTENGLRAGVLAGAPPPGFQTLLDSEADTVNPLRMTFNVRKEAVIPTAGPVDRCAFAVLADLGGKPAGVELKQARCGVLVRPRRGADGRVRVWCEPQIQHGTRREWFRPNEDGTEFVKSDEVPLEKYPGLGFEVALGADDYLLIGWPADRPATLGSALFRVELEERPRQRVLVLRARPMTPAAPDLPPIGNPLLRPAAGRK